MGDDIPMSEWRDCRFVFIEQMALLTDYAYWCDHLHELDEWCKLYDLEFQGMSVQFPTEEAKTMFILRWS